MTRILSASSIDRLNTKINEMAEKGWSTIGSHRVVEVIHQNQYAGSQHMRTLIDREYSITITKTDEKV